MSLKNYTMSVLTLGLRQIVVKTFFRSLSSLQLLVPLCPCSLPPRSYSWTLLKKESLFSDFSDWRNSSWSSRSISAAYSIKSLSKATSLGSDRAFFLGSPSSSSYPAPRFILFMNRPILSSSSPSPLAPINIYLFIISSIYSACLGGLGIFP